MAQFSSFPKADPKPAPKVAPAADAEPDLVGPELEWAEGAPGAPPTPAVPPQAQDVPTEVPTDLNITLDQAPATPSQGSAGVSSFQGDKEIGERLANAVPAKPATPADTVTDEFISYLKGVEGHAPKKKHDHAPILGKESDPVARELMSKEDFGVAMAGIAEAFPNLRQTSDFRTSAKNEKVKGHRLSKHQIEMAHDFAGSDEDMQAGLAMARKAGLSAKVHDAGSGMHLHVQAMSTGRVTQEWLDNNPLSTESQAVVDSESRSYPYNTDGAGKWSVGHGHLINDGTSPKGWEQGLTSDEVEELFQEDVIRATNQARKDVGPDVFDALPLKSRQLLVDFSYNLGPSWSKKFPKMTRAVLAGDMEGAYNQMERWKTAPSGEKSKLKGRNAAVADFFFGKVDGDMAPDPSAPLASDRPDWTRP